MKRIDEHRFHHIWVDLSAQVDHEIIIQVHHQVWEQVENRVGDRVGDRVRGEMWAKELDQIDE